MFWSRLATLHNPWTHLHDLQGEVNRLFEHWGDRGRGLFGLASFPAVNLWEDDDALHLETELPGLEMKDLEIFVTGHTQLTLKGERKPVAIENAVPHRQERGFGSFVRSLTLPVAVDENKIEAKFENGVLRLRMPKHEAARPRKIEIKV